MPTREEAQRQAITTYATELGVDPTEALAIGGQESGFNNAAVSPKGAKGTMQVMDPTSADMAPKYGPDRRRQGIGYYKDLLADPELAGEKSDLGALPHETRRAFALQGYNGGPGTLRGARAQARKLGLDANDPDIVLALMPTETQGYVPGVLGRMTASSGSTKVTAGAGVQDVGLDDPEQELLALANGDTSTPDADPEAELTAMASGAPAAAPTATPPARGLGESFYDRTIGRATSGLDAALGGAPSALAGAAGAYSAGDDAGVQEALTAGGGTAQRLKGIPGGLLETGVDLAFPGAVAGGAAVGAGTEAVTGSKTAGDVAEFAANVGPAATKIARGGIRGVKSLFGGQTAAQDVTAGLAAERTAQEVGKDLQAPKGGANEAITKTAEESTAKYKAAGAAGRGVRVKPDSILKVAKRAMKDSAAAGNPVTGGSRRVIMNLVRATRGKKTGVLNAAGNAVRSGGKDLGIDELIEVQSNLRREIAKLPYTNASRRHLIDVSKSMDDAMEAAAQGTPVAQKLREARTHYREVTLPTRKTASKVAAAETPESATRVATAGKQPSRFQRMEAGAPGSAEPLRSAAFNDMVQAATENGQLNVRKLASQLSKAEASGQLKNLGNTTARQRTIRAIQKVAKFQKAAQRAPVVGAVGGGTTGLFGLGAGYATGRVIQVATQSERASRALLRLAQARQGSAGWKTAAKKLKDILGPSAATSARTVRNANQESDNGND